MAERIGTKYLAVVNHTPKDSLARMQGESIRAGSRWQRSCGELRVLKESKAPAPRQPIC